MQIHWTNAEEVEVVECKAMASRGNRRGEAGAKEDLSCVATG